MLPKSKRARRDDFNELKKKNTVRGVFVDIMYSPSKEIRFACVISKKKIKLAVDRNRVRRKIYSALEKIKLNKPHIVIIYPKQVALTSPHKKIVTEIQSIFDTL